MHGKLIFILLLQFLCTQAAAQQKKGDDTKDSTLIICKVETEAVFPGGEKAWKKYITSGLSKIDFAAYFPAPARDCSINFAIAFTVSGSGSVIKIEIRVPGKFPLCCLQK